MPCSDGVECAIIVAPFRSVGQRAIDESLG